MQMSGLHLLHKLNYGQFCVEIRIFGYHGNRGRSKQSLNDTFKLADPTNPLFQQLSGLHLLRKLNYSQFCAYIRKFSLPWQQGSV